MSNGQDCMTVFCACGKEAVMLCDYIDITHLPLVHCYKPCCATHGVKTEPEYLYVSSPPIIALEYCEEHAVLVQQRQQKPAL